MQSMTIGALMSPVEVFPRISSQAAFVEVIQALKKSQAAFLAGKGKQRILLVEDEHGVVLGKISPMDVVRGLEPRYDKIDSLKDDIRYGLPHVVRSMKDEFRLWQEPLDDLCRKAGQIKVERMFNSPGPSQAVKISDSMDTAFHLFVTYRHDSLYVLEDEKIVGLLRFSDVYNAICETVEACALGGHEA